MRQHDTGLQIANRDCGAEEPLDADVVVDAMGRDSRTPVSFFFEAWAISAPWKMSWRFD
jgi:hypothetical protein